MEQKPNLDNNMRQMTTMGRKIENNRFAVMDEHNIFPGTSSGMTL